MGRTTVGARSLRLLVAVAIAAALTLVVSGAVGSRTLPQLHARSAVTIARHSDGASTATTRSPRTVVLTSYNNPGGGGLEYWGWYVSTVSCVFWGQVGLIAGQFKGYYCEYVNGVDDSDGLEMWVTPN